ncbi:MAG: Hpt domain-containing protein [Candidatus Nanopelagicales bacterium]
MTQTAPVFAEGLDDICQEFLVESYENLDELDRALVALEQEPGSRPLIASIFRTIHTIKGTSGFLAFTRLESVTHVGENVLSQLRDGHLTLTPEITTTLLHLVDTVRELLGTIEVSGREGEVDIDPVVAMLNDVLEGRIGGAAPAEEPTVAATEQVEAVLVEEIVVVEPDGTVDVIDVIDAVETVQVQAPAAPAPTAPAAAVPEQPSYDAPEAENDVRRSVADSTIRVDVGLLDQLMRMVGELVLTRNQVLQHVGDLQHIQLQRASQRLNLIATELQDGVMKTETASIQARLRPTPEPEIEKMSKRPITAPSVRRGPPGTGRRRRAAPSSTRGSSWCP